MSTKKNFPGTPTNRPFRYEVDRRKANQIRSEFLAELFANLYRSVREAFDNGTDRITDKP